MKDASADYGSCPPTGDRKTPATEDHEGLTDDQSQPSLQADYTEVCMPPSASSAAASMLTLSPDFGSCKTWIAAILLGFAVAGLFLVVILLITGRPEPGWMEIATAVLFATSSLWLYTLVEQEAIIREGKAQNKDLDQKRIKLRRVQKELVQIESLYGSNIETARKQVDTLRGCVSSTMVTLVENWARERGVHMVQRLTHDGTTSSSEFSCETAEELMEQVLVPIWEQYDSFPSNRSALSNWITNDGQGGRSMKDVDDLIQRVARDQKQLATPHASEIPRRSPRRSPASTPRQ